MRLTFAWLATLALCGVAHAQKDFQPVEWADCYEVTRDNGAKLKAIDFEKVEAFYKFTLPDGRKLNIFSGVIKSVTPLKGDDCEKFVPIEPESSPTMTSYRAGVAKTAAKRKARTSGRTTARLSFSGGGLSGSSFGAGSTATGIPLHVGPRGGIYHITSGGNKAYHPRGF